MTASASGEAKAVKFEDIPLKVGSTLQLQPAGIPGAPHYTVRFIGAVKNSSLLTTLPIVEHDGLWMRANGEYIIRTLAGRHIYAFMARLIKARSHPYPYAHFSYPATIQARQVRRSPRVDLKLDSRATKADGETLPVAILDLSLHGALVQAGKALGEAGDSVSITLPITLPETSRELSLSADIRNLTDGDRPRYGLEFKPLAADDTLLLHFFIDYRLAEGMGA